MKSQIIAELGKVYIVAELSGNHGGDIRNAKLLIDKAKEAGVDAVKLQTYTADTITLDCHNAYFDVPDGLWSGKNYYELYQEAHTPWEWHKELNDYAKQLGLTLFSTPFDETAVDFLETTLQPPFYKIASFELTHIPLLEKVAQTCKPVIMSTGMATEAEIGEAVDTLRSHGCPEIVLLKCISQYPADPKAFHLNTLPLLREKFHCAVGISDHSIGDVVVLGAVALGACFVEKHIVLSRDADAVDAAFSSTPEEFADLVKKIRLLSAAMGKAHIGPSSQEMSELRSRRSIFVSKDMRKGDIFSPENIKIVRPSNGLAPKFWHDVLGKRANRALERGQPLSYDSVE
ncbi:MAG: pseudaminic acid synthase [Verrucomicrobia bacterium GWF2_51_19]|nr:MAG: pseudaminic acid synthase [Verrucomicrobia bacterium GWF2_51_19]